VSSPVALGVIVGLLVGKPIGITLFTYIAVRVFRGQLPDGVRFGSVAAGSVLCAIGFTVSLFIADLAFTDDALISEAKAGVLAASLIAGVLGSMLLRATLDRSKAG
jgi:NhaA family Na+:H+ antiporter